MTWGSRAVRAEDGSVAIGGDNRAPVSIINGIPPEQTAELLCCSVDV
jgi:hypothetical protein